MEFVLWETQIYKYYVRRVQEVLSPKHAKVRWQHQGRIRGLPEGPQTRRMGRHHPSRYGENHANSTFNRASMSSNIGAFLIVDIRPFPRGSCAPAILMRKHAFGASRSNDHGTGQDPVSL